MAVDVTVDADVDVNVDVDVDADVDVAADVCCCVFVCDCAFQTAAVNRSGAGLADEDADVSAGVGADAWC